MLIHILAVSGCFNVQMNYMVTKAEQEPQILFTFLIPVTQTLNQDDLFWSMERMTWKIDEAPSIAEKPRECALLYLKEPRADLALLGAALTCDLSAIIDGPSSVRKASCTKRSTTSQNGQSAGDHVLNHRSLWGHFTTKFNIWQFICNLFS